ncbi:MAG: hypothetical protein NT062_06555 [Proteobacteria bacterium]|nr:hypothetical protein [Pseudomonadota bacterium]
MRITGNRLIEQTAIATTRQQGRVGELAAEVSSGVRVAKPSDDPAAWLAAHRAKLRSTITDGTTAAMQSGRERLVLTDGALAEIHDIVSQSRTLAIQANNDSYGAASRKEIGTHIRALFSSAVAAANAQSPDGEYLLAGGESLTPPFDPTTGGYVGDGTTREVPMGGVAHQPATIPGSELTAATGGVDVLPMLERLATALETNDTATLRGSLTDLGTALDQLGTLRTRGGGMMAILDDAKTAHDIMHQNLATSIADHVESNTIEAAGDLAKASQALEISRAVSSRIVSLVGSH